MNFSYYAFGSLIQSRTESVQGYRFGYNGKEKDKETSTYDYGFRIYNPSLGRFLSVDPLTMTYPWYTPFQFAGNTPIKYIDIDGLEPGQNKKRNKPLVNNHFNGGGIFGALGGVRGKYTRHHGLPGKIPKSTPSKNKPGEKPSDSEDKEEPKSEMETKTETVTVDNPLVTTNERDDRLPPGENMKITKVEPTNKKGYLIIDGSDNTDDNSGSLRIEVTNKDGVVIDTQDYTFSTDRADKSDNVRYDFDLQKGEYIRVINRGTSIDIDGQSEKTKTTKVPIKKDSKDDGGDSSDD